MGEDALRHYLHVETPARFVKSMKLVLPDTSSADLTAPSSETSTLEPDRRGTYVVQLVVDARGMLRLGLLVALLLHGDDLDGDRFRFNGDHRLSEHG